MACDRIKGLKMNSMHSSCDDQNFILALDTLPMHLILP